MVRLKNSYACVMFRQNIGFLYIIFLISSAIYCFLTCSLHVSGAKHDSKDSETIAYDKRGNAVHQVSEQFHSQQAVQLASAYQMGEVQAEHRFRSIIVWFVTRCLSILFGRFHQKPEAKDAPPKGDASVPTPLHSTPLTSIDFLGKKGEKRGASSRYLLR